MAFKKPTPEVDTADEAETKAARSRPYVIADEAALYAAHPLLFKMVPNHQALQAIWKAVPRPNLPGVVAAVEVPPPALTPIEEAIHNTPVKRL